MTAPRAGGNGARTLPVLALRDLVLFPGMVLPILVGRSRSVAAVRAASAAGSPLFLVLQRTPQDDDPEPDALHGAGTVARIVEVVEGGAAEPLQVVLEGIERGWWRPPFEPRDLFLSATIETDPPPPLAPGPEGPEPAPGIPELLEDLVAAYARYARLDPRIPPGIPDRLASIRDPLPAAWLVGGHLPSPAPERQRLLEAIDAVEAIRIAEELVHRETRVLEAEAHVQSEVRRQREGGIPLVPWGDPPGSRGTVDEDPWAELSDSVRNRNLPGSVRERVQRELTRLHRLAPASPEAGVIQNWIDWVLAVPWEAPPPPRPILSEASAFLDSAHHGLEEVKERILDHIAVLSLLEGPLRSPILCLVGPPGVGKTSLGRSIAEALGREFVRISLGGVRDEAEIRGHRRTYVGAQPGRILQAMRRSGTRNPVFLLDELDKLAHDAHGDPAAALLEVLDPEQNRAFNDHFLELDYDLSEVLWIATANTLGGIPEPLRDRMEILRIPGYLDTEKRAIARAHLWPRQLAQHGLGERGIELSDEALGEILHRYTREAGVRELDRRLAQVARKLARSVAEGPSRGQTGGARRVEAPHLPELLGPPPHLPSGTSGPARDWIGIARGLAWTASGGEMMEVEVSVVPGRGAMQLTGTLGEVLKESGIAAVTWARGRAREMGLDPHFHEQVDLHIHLPEGATPKDGPSAGITIAVALLSALTGIPTRPEVAMTGEITLRGRVLPVGGIREKAVAALRCGIRTMIVPAGNAPEFELLPPEVLEGVELRPVSSMQEVLEAALLRLPTAGVQSTPHWLQ